MKKFIIMALIAIIMIGCATTYTNRSPVGEMFPNISGESLEQKEIEMPEYFRGDQVVLLLGYKQDSQFDIDRWLIGLDMTNTVIKAYELPTIQGMLPRMFSTFIDEGMRKGIPKELWGGVITVYADGAELQEFTGNENPNNARVLLLDENGKVIHFYDRGFSVFALNELKKMIE
jgi:hypothetical protein